jgi:hypothetical protein
MLWEKVNPHKEGPKCPIGKFSEAAVQRNNLKGLQFEELHKRGDLL